MKLAASLMLAFALLSTFAIGQTQTIFVMGNNKTANDVRKALVHQAKKSKSCLVPTNDPAKADLTLDVNQGAPGSGLFTALGDRGSHSAALSVTNKAGVVVFTGDSDFSWERVYVKMDKQLCAKAGAQ